MNVLVVSASQRSESLSAALATRIISLFDPSLGCSATTIVDLADHREALWSVDGDQPSVKATAMLREAAQSADALVFVVPEWGGMVPPLAKNFFLVMDPFSLAHKPGLIVALSAGTGGAYPVAELRLGSYKNTRLCWLPEHIIVRNAQQSQLISSDFDESSIGKRLRNALSMLMAYARAFKTERQYLLSLTRDIPYGM